MTEELAEPWASAMRDRNIGRPDNGRPSYSALGTAANVSTETVRRLVNGVGVPSQSTIQRVADALGKDVREVSRWAGQARTVRKPYEPPDEAHLLGQPERDAVDQIIRLLTRAGQAGESGGDTSPTKDAPSNVRPLRGAKGPQPHKQAASRTRKDPPDQPIG